MPVTSSSVPPKGRSISICSSDSGKTTHSRPRAFTSDPTAKLILASLICSNTATPHPEGDRMLPDRQGDRHTAPRGRPQGSQPRINPTPALTKIRCPTPSPIMSYPLGKVTAILHHPKGDRKGPSLASTQPPPLQRYGATRPLLVVFVRAGVV